MNPKDMKVGQIVVDKFGNEYEVKYIDNNDTAMPIRLCCTKFVAPVDVQDDNVGFDGAGKLNLYWIYKSKKAAKEDGVENMDILTVESLKSKEDTK